MGRVSTLNKKDAIFAKIVIEIKNTMTNRYSSEKLFEYRKELLPTVAKNWDQMTNIEKDQLTRMNTFLWFALHHWVN